MSTRKFKAGDWVERQKNGAWESDQIKLVDPNLSDSLPYLFEDSTWRSQHEIRRQQFKEGDRVTITSIPNMDQRHTDAVGWEYEMEESIGITGIIVGTGLNDPHTYAVKTPNAVIWTWLAECLIPERTKMEQKPFDPEEEPELDDLSANLTMDEYHEINHRLALLESNGIHTMNRIKAAENGIRSNQAL